MSDLNTSFALITQILDNLHRDHSIEAMRGELLFRPRLLQMLNELINPDVPPIPAPSNLRPFSVSGNQFLLNGVPFKFTGYNLREAAFYGEPMEETRWGDWNFLVHQVRTAKEFLNGKVIRFYAAHINYTVEQTIPRVIAVLDLLHQFNLYAIVVLTDGVYSGYGIKDTEHNFRGRHTHEFYAGGYNQNYLPKMRKMVEAIKDHPAIMMLELGNEFLIPFPPFVPNTPTDQQYVNALNFFKVAADSMREAAPHIPIGTGFVSAWEVFANHAYGGLELGKQLYAHPTIDAASVHTYQSRANVHKWGDTGFHLENEMKLQGHPIYIGETGMIFGTQDGGFTGRLGAETKHRVDGLLQWALQASDAPRAGGDGAVGMNQFQTTMWHFYTGNMKYLATEVFP